MTGRPSWCKQCRHEPVDPGNAVCPKCASSILKRTCHHPWRPELLVLRTRNGYERPQLRCRLCYATLGRPKLREINPSEVHGAISDPEPVRETCARCGRKDAIEIHHWAPWHLFADADSWPTSPLCPDCHRLWHQTTNTQGPRRPA